MSSLAYGRRGKEYTTEQITTNGFVSSVAALCHPFIHCRSKRHWTASNPCFCQDA